MTAIVSSSEAEGTEEDQRIQRSKGGHLAACARHRISILRRHQKAAEAVEQDVGADSGATAFRQRLRELDAELPLLVEVLGVRDCLTRCADGVERCGEDLIAVQQQFHSVAGVGRRGIGLHGGKERGVCHRQLWKLVVRLHSST
jgi:hypothetical protein